MERRRQVEREEERKAEGVYRSIANQLKDYPIQEVAEARKFVARMIKSGEGVEEVLNFKGSELGIRIIHVLEFEEEVGAKSLVFCATCLVISFYSVPVIFTGTVFEKFISIPCTSFSYSLKNSHKFVIADD